MVVGVIDGDELVVGSCVWVVRGGGGDDGGGGER